MAGTIFNHDLRIDLAERRARLVYLSKDGELPATFEIAWDASTERWTIEDLARTKLPIEPL